MLTQDDIKKIIEVVATKEDVKELLPGLEVIAAGRKTYGEAWRIADYLVAKLKNMK